MVQLAPNGSVDPTWIEVLQAWAEGEPLIAELHLFGSRVKGTAGDNSDLDVAVVLRCRQEEEWVLKWMDNAERWRMDLVGRLPISIDLKDIREGNVGEAVAEHGVPVYRAPAIDSK